MRGFGNEVFQVRKEGAETYLRKKSTNRLKDCLQKNGGSGKDIGRNLVLGALTGGIAGAYVGGTAGTFTVPGLGTTVGAVGGAVFGAAAGAVSGVVSGLVWPAIDCIMYVTKYEEKYLKDDFFKEEMPFIDVDNEEIQSFNDLLNAPVTSDVKIVE